MITRRNFVQLAGTSMVGAASVAAAASPLGSLPARPTSVAEDFVFPEWIAAMRAAAEDRGNSADRAFARVFSASWVEAGRNLSTAVLSTLPAPGVELFEPSVAHALAIEANDRLAERVRGRNGGAGLATISAFDPHAAKEAERAIGKLRLSGLSLGANRGKRLDHHSLWDIYAFAQSADVAIYLPASYAPSAGDAPYRAAGAPGVMAGASQDSAKHAEQLIFGGVLDQFPNLKVVLARLGEGAPYWHMRLEDTYALRKNEGLSVPKRKISDYFGDNIFLTLADVESPEVAEFCSRATGHRGLMGVSACNSNFEAAQGRLSIARAFNV